VTIFGESAGAQSVLALMSSTPASGLFARAISQSAPWNPFFNREVYTNGIYPALLNATSCAGNADDASQLACLRALPAETFISNSTQDAVNAGSAAAQRAYSQAPLLIATVEPYLPVVGTGVVDGIPNNLIREGRLPAAGIPFMVGNVKNEGVSCTLLCIIYGQALCVLIDVTRRRSSLTAFLSS
jgi:acetylcholinesterase